METQTEEETSTQADASVFRDTTQNTSNLPMVVKTTGDKDLINRSEMTPEDLQEVVRIVASHNIMNTASNLYFGAAPQNKLSTVVDSLLEGVKTKDAGLAGQLAIELNDGIDMLMLDETKNQIINGQGWFVRFFSGIITLFGGIANYIDYMIQNQDSIMDKFDQLVAKYNNRIQTLTNNSNNLDTLRDATIDQINGLRIHIAAGEDILESAKILYAQKAVKAVKGNDTLELQAVRDMYQQIASFDTRFLDLKIAYVESSSVAIPRIRRTQEAIKIEIQGIIRGILFVIPKLKTAVVELLALYETKAAQADRMALDSVESKINTHTTDIVDEVVSTGKESQGLVLKRAEEIGKLVDSTTKAIEADRENEKKSAENRREAEKLLVILKEQVDSSLKKANIDVANEEM